MHVSFFCPPFSYFSCIFFVFSAPDPGWGASSFFRNFFRISGLEGILSSIPGTRNRNSKGFSRVLLGLWRVKKDLGVLGAFPWFLPEQQEMEDQGKTLTRTPTGLPPFLGRPLQILPPPPPQKLCQVANPRKSQRFRQVANPRKNQRLRS